MSYLILARKYRPQKFSDLTGQETTSKILRSAILNDRVAPAYLFSGTRGTGKTTSARIFAKALNCRKRDPAAGQEAPFDPCDDCASCREIAQGGSLDVLEIDAASHTGVDNMREVVINTVAFAPVRDRYKIFIIDEVHMLSTPTFNALLKTMEEPPPHVVFILCTTEFHKIPATIASRCQRFRFLPLTQKQILSNLRNVAASERISIADDALALIARSAGGSMRDALSLFDQTMSSLAPAEGGASPAIDLRKIEETLGVVRDDLLLQFVEAVAVKDAKGVLECVSRTLQEGYDLTYFLKELRELFREMLIEKCGYGDPESLNPLKTKLPVDRFDLHRLLRATQILTKCADQMRWNDLPRIVFECYAVWLCQDSVSASDILDGLASTQSAPPPPRPTLQKEAFRPPQAVPVPQAIPAPESARQPAQTVKAAADVSQKTAPPENVRPSVPVSGPAQSEKDDVPGPAGSAELRTLWNKVVAEVQQIKPSMIRALETAVVDVSDNRIDLGFSSSLWLESVRKNSRLFEEMLEKAARKKIGLSFRQVEGSQAKPAPISVPASRVQDVPEYVTEVPPDEDEDAGSIPEEGPRPAPMFEEDSDPMVGAELDSSQIEDKQLRGLAQLFPGKLTKKPGRRP